jgi:hypothetical protein
VRAEGVEPPWAEARRLLRPVRQPLCATPARLFARLPRMSRVDRWSVEPRPSPSEIACQLARDRFWRDEHHRLIGTHPDWPDAAYFLDLSEELAHALVLVLSRLPVAHRSGFADAFYESRAAAAWLDDEAEERLERAAGIVLRVLDVLAFEICDERTLDFLRGAAQGDDLTRTPAPAAEQLRTAIAQMRLEAESQDPSDPRGVASLAVVEVLNPSSGVVDLKEVLARCAWSAVETRHETVALGFLLEVDGLLAL